MCDVTPGYVSVTSCDRKCDRDVVVVVTQNTSDETTFIQRIDRCSKQSQMSNKRVIYLTRCFLFIYLKRNLNVRNL